MNRNQTIAINYSMKRAKKRKLARANYLKSKYGLTVEEYERLCTKQENKCAICKGYRKKLFVDHCHKTKKIRGLLCSKCNRGLGYFKDNAQGLQVAMDYLTR